jgi:hypothetical protein
VEPATDLPAAKPIERFLLRRSVGVVSIDDIEVSRGSRARVATGLNGLAGQAEKRAIQEPAVARRRHWKIARRIDFRTCLE